MGRQVAEAVGAAEGMHAVAFLDALATTGKIDHLPVFTDPVACFLEKEPDVVIDFTNAEWTPGLAEAALARNVRMVIGTTGLSEDFMKWLEKEAAARKLGVVVAANFAIGAVLMMRFAEIAAPYFETAEIIEFHHDAKIDAPSGTAMATVERMARAKDSWAADPTQKVLLDGARGGNGPAGIRVHAVRMRGMVAHQEVILGTTGQTLVIRHDTTDRTSFMPGVALAVKRIAEHPGLTVGLDALL